MATEKLLIDANVLERLGYTSIVKFWGGLVDKILPLSEAPTVDAVEVVHGHWKIIDFAGSMKCSVCGEEVFNESNYCPSCGAYMRGDSHA